MMLGELYQGGATPELYKFIMNSSSEMSKASRRKQSKPNRLFSNNEAGQIVSVTEQQQLDMSPKISPSSLQIAAHDHDDGDKDPMDLSTKGSSPAVTEVSPSHRLESEKTPPLQAISQSMACPPDMQMVNFPCHTCGEVFSSRAQQEQHISERHSSSDGVTSKTSPPGPIFPTAYHRLATDLGLGPIGATGLMPPLSVAKPMDSSKALISTPNGSSIPKPGTPGVGGKGTAGTVFQREAYCEICQREFCNKYFLKTHKANIHGIIDPNDPKSAAVAAKAAQAPKINHSMTESLVSQKAPVPPSSSSSKGSGGDSMDDFCEICQKHFCNKYYLKKHKVDVHNIRPDGSKPVSTTDSHADSRNLVTTASAATASSALPLPMMVPPLNPTSMNNMLFVNPFVPSMAAMSMVPPMMQPQFFMPGMGGLAGAPPAAPVVSTSPELKTEPKSMLVPEKGDIKPGGGERAETFCNICKKEFCNSYYLQVHKASKHGIFDDPAASALMMMAAEREKAEREGQLMQASSNSPSPTSMAAGNSLRPVILTSEKERTKAPAFPLTPGNKIPAGPPVMPTMTFDAMLAAKQADRIACDICNKELCNKYFLKAHKLKMHGVTSPPEERISGQSARDSGERGVPKSMSRLSPTNQAGAADMTSPESLAKLGIDPEAYCFLCKKEFCSKYFLKTHKLNIHGIKSDDSTRGTTPKAPTPPNGLSPSNLAGHSLPISEAMMQWKWKDHNQRGVPPTLHDGKGTNSDKFTWRWKETANSTRVFCDICNKELCNKYFLRTHKQKIHGITDTNSPAKSSRAAAMNSGVMTNVTALQQTSKLNHELMSNVESIKQGHQSPLSQSQSSPPPSTMDKIEPLREDVCQICGMVFANTEAMNEHVKLEHNDENIQVLDEPSTNNGEQTDGQVYSCSQCPFKANVLTDMHQHETRKHNMEANTCKICHVTFSHISMLIKHMKKIHSKSVPASGMKRVSTDAVMQKPKRKVQCNFCSERFLTRQLCQSHIRNTHGIKLPLMSKNLSSTERRVFACDKCRYVCKSIKNLRTHQMIRHKEKERNGSLSPDHKQSEVVMQRFTITEVSGLKALAATTVKLPVYEEIKDQVQFNLTLKPTFEDSLSGDQELMDTSTS